MNVTPEQGEDRGRLRESERDCLAGSENGARAKCGRRS